MSTEVPVPNQQEGLTGEALDARVHDLVDKCYGKTAIESGRDYSGNFTKIAEFANELKRKYPETWMKTRAYYGMASGTYGEEDIKHEDFPGDDSVVKFLEGLVANG